MRPGHSCEICRRPVEPYTQGGEGFPPTYRCPVCGLVQVRFDTAEDADAWRGTYRADGEYHRTCVLAGFNSFEDRLKHDLRLARIRMENLTRFVKGGRLLDVGASNGAFVQMAWSYGFYAIGVEPDPWVVEEVTGRGNRHIRCQCFEKFAASKDADGYSAVTFLDSFEHLLSPREALEAVGRLLDSWGVLMIEMPDADAPGFRDQGPCWKHFKPREHAYLYGKSHVLKLLEMHRFSLIDSIVPYPDRRVYYARKN